MNMGDAMAWLVTHPRPVIQPDEGPEEYGARQEEWEFQYSLMCELLHDIEHDQKGNPTN